MNLYYNKAFSNNNSYGIPAKAYAGLKKRFLLPAAFMLFFAVLLLLSGCGSSGNGEMGENGNDTAIRPEDLTVYELALPGAEKEYEFLYLTDMHLIVQSEDADAQLQEYERQRIPVFETEGIAPSSVQFAQWADYAGQQEFDGLLLGGDILDSPSSANLKLLEETLHGLSVPWLYTPGNHDWTFPWEYMTPKGKEAYLSLLSPYMDGNTAIHTMEYDDFTIAAVDNSSNQINPSVMEEYKKLLAEKKPVIVLLHVPLYTQSILEKSKQAWKGGVILGGGIHGGIYPDTVSAEFLNITTAEDSPVILVLAGHVHLSDKSDIQGEKNIPQITGDAGYKGKGVLLRIGKTKE